MLRFNLDGSNMRVFCTGIRNTEKLQFRPGTKDIYGLDHGSDWWGAYLGDKKGNQPFTDHNPPEELNHYVEGGFYGHPYIVGDRLPRAEYAKRSDILELAESSLSPELIIPAHSAPNGFTFYDGKMFPELQGNMVACFQVHGTERCLGDTGWRI